MAGKSIVDINGESLPTSVDTGDDLTVYIGTGLNTNHISPIVEQMNAMADFMDQNYFLVENTKTGEKVVGKMKDTISKYIEWNRSGLAKLTRLDNENAKVLYGKV